MFAGRIIQTGIASTVLLFLFSPFTSASQIATANGEIYVNGTVTGDYTDTQANDGVYQSIMEEVSSSNKNKGYSHMGHKWFFEVQAGSSAAFYIKAYHTPNSEGDDFRFEWSTDNSIYYAFMQVTKTSDDGTYNFASLPPDISGTVYIQVKDMDQTKGNLSLDTLFIDHMYIETEENTSPPAAPSDLQAAAASTNVINLSWSDNSSNEDGFRIERSLDGATWDPLSTVGANIDTFQDTDLDSSTTYYYIVQAFNIHGDSDWSNVASATTMVEGSYVTSMVDPGAAPGSYKDFDLDLHDRPGIGYADDGMVNFAFWNGIDWDIEIVESGGPGISVAFSPDGIPSLTHGWGTQRFAEKIGSSWSIEVIESGCYNDHTSMVYDPSGIPTIAYYRDGNKKTKGFKLACRINGTWDIETVSQAYASHKSVAYDLQGNPALAFCDDTDSEVWGIDTLKFAHWNGSSWDIEVVESGVTGYGAGVVLKYDPITGWPAMAHASEEGVRFVRWDGSAWQGELLYGPGQYFTLSGFDFDSHGTPYVGVLKYGSPNKLRIGHWDGLAWQYEIVTTEVSGGGQLRIDSNDHPTLIYEGSIDGVSGLIFAHK